MIVISMYQKIILLWSLGTQDNCFSPPSAEIRTNREESSRGACVLQGTLN